MTTITNKERLTAVSKLLEDTFTPQLAQFKERLREYYISQNAEKHPTFANAACDPLLKPYLQRETNIIPSFTYENSHGTLNGEYMFWPPYGSDTTLLDNGAIIDANEKSYRHRIGVSDLFVATSLSTHPSPDLVNEYTALAKTRQNAFNELNKLFFSYNNREKFELDFPELAVYLPKKPIKSKGTSLVIPVADFKASLKNLGVPATA